jgi:NADH-quinone oxidoreductase subunit L
VLALFALVAGFVSLPKMLGNYDPFGKFMSTALPSMPESPARSHITAEEALLAVSIAISLLGIYLAYLYFRNKRWSEAAANLPVCRGIHAFFRSGWMFDNLYDLAFVKPYKAIAYGNRKDFVDNFFSGLAAMVAFANFGLSRTQTGRLRNYTVGLIMGAIIVAAIVLSR